MQRYSTVVLILGALATIAPLSIDAYLPAFPAIGQAFAADPALVQQTLSSYLFAYAVMALFHGTLSDSFGRRPVIVVSLLLYALGSLCAALAPDLGWLVAGRTLQGLTAGAGMIVGQAIVRDRYHGAVAQRTLAYIVMVFGVSPALAPIIGGWMSAHFGWRSIFYAMAAVALMVALSYLKVLPETLPPSRRTPFRWSTMAGAYRAIFRDRAFMSLSISFGFTFGGFAFFIGSAPSFIIDVLHLPETAFGWLFVPLVIGMMSGAWLATRLAHRMTSDRIIATGFVLMGFSCAGNVAYCAMAVPAVPWAVLPVMVFTFGLALVSPSMVMRILDLVPERAGMASSVLSFTQMVLFSVVTGAFVPWTLGNALKMSLGVTIGFLISAVGWYSFQRRTPSGARKQARN
jgi:DHA1 family bicyclomycin/chloramphenicol resistance-like MFS transporter